MRVIRFVSEHDEILIGADHGDGSATILIDTLGILGHDDDGTGIIDALRGKHAIVADDDENMRELMATVLDRAACTTTVCRDGREAMQAIADAEADIVVSDIRMPHHDGYEIYSAARKRDARIPVVLVTGYGYDPTHSLLRVAREGHEDVLYKPFTPRQLLEKLNASVAKASGSPAEGLVDTHDRAVIRSILAPILPCNILCVGRNFAGPTVDPSVRDEPLEVFMKPSTAVQNPGGMIRLPDLEDGSEPCVDCEGELAVIIGSEMRDVTAEAAMAHVFGFTIANDVTARRYQTASGPPQFMRGKGFDTFCPIGPVVVPATELPPVEKLTIRTSVNDRVIREGRASEMLRTIPQILCELSRNYTLSRGSLVLTGAPPVLHPRDIGAALHAGDVVSIEIEGIGRLTNTIAASDAT